MGLFSRLFGTKKNNDELAQRSDNPNIIDIQSDDDRMNWAMEKSQLTLHYFERCLKSPYPNQQYFSCFPHWDTLVKNQIVDQVKFVLQF